MTAPPDAAWLQWMLNALQAGQLAVLQGLHALGLVPALYGQPAWPWAWRLGGDTLLFDTGQARRLALTLGLLAIALLAAVAGLAWRRGRWPLLALAALLPLAAPWPQAAAVWTAATPTSFHASPTGFGAAGIVHGHRRYLQLCAGCHGTDGRGQGPLAARQPVWPPNLAGPLLWRRADGDLLWNVLHGMHDARTGQATMPAFGDRLSPEDAWATIDALKALAAGQALRQTGQWLQPVRLPAFALDCGPATRRQRSDAWRGQRLRIVAPAASPADGMAALPDARLTTLALRPPGDPGAPAAPAAVDADCTDADAAAWPALALIAGHPDDPRALAGTQLIVDRAGWLRAMSAPGMRGWSEDDLVCRGSQRSSAPIAPTPAGDATRALATPAPGPDGLDALIARMDAEPVRFVKGGVVH